MKTPSDEDISKFFDSLTKPPKKETDVEKYLREIKQLQEKLKAK